MKIKGLNEYDIVNYKQPSMFIIFPKCSFKCDKECGQNICQNSALAREPSVETDINSIIERYKNNPLTHAVVCGGLEPFDTWEELQDFIMNFRYWSADPIIIYTGYNKNEIQDKLEWLKLYKPVIVKFGRFIPNSNSRFDEVLGITLASENQYAEVIS